MNLTSGRRHGSSSKPRANCARSVAALVCSASLLMSASACGGGIKVAANGVDEAARAVGAVPREVVLDSAAVSRLADEAGVADEVIEQVAPQVDSQSQWNQQVTRAGQIYGKVKDHEVSQVVVDVACDGLRGEITSQGIYDSIVEQIAGLTQSEAQALVEDTAELWQDMYDAQTTGTDQDKAAVSIACYTFDQIG